MKYKLLKQLSDEEFQRKTGVIRGTFDIMLETLRAANKRLRKRGGPKRKISVVQQLLMTLEYLREYRTYFHLAQDYGLSESRCYQICCWVEDTLIRSGKFSLPGKKALREGLQAVIVDVAESPIQRPKKKGRPKSQKPAKTLLLWKEKASQLEIPDNH
jgi:hypothetical protein